MNKKEIKKHLNNVGTYIYKSGKKLDELERCSHWRFFKFNKLIKEHKEIMRKWNEEEKRFNNLK